MTVKTSALRARPQARSYRQASIRQAALLPAGGLPTLKEGNGSTKRGKQGTSEEGFPGQGTTRPKLEMPAGASRCIGVLAGLMGSTGQANQTQDEWLMDWTGRGAGHGKDGETRGREM